MPHHPAGLGNLRGDVLPRGIPKPLLFFFGVSTALAGYVVGRVLLNPWGTSSDSAHALNSKITNKAMTERERQAEIHTAEAAMRKNDLLKPERTA
jgi:hypothetical protein